MDEAMKAKFEEALKDEALVKELLGLDTPEDVQAKLKERGVEISVENVVAIRDALSKAIENGGELSEDDLENVAGGFISAFAIGILVALGVTGTAFGAALTARTW